MLDPVGLAAAEQVHHLERGGAGRRRRRSRRQAGDGTYTWRAARARTRSCDSASSSTSRPRPPASTTPASASTSKLLGGLVERDHRRVRRGDHHAGEIGAIGAGILGRFCGGLQHRHDGARHRFAHRCDDQTDRVAQRGGEDGAVDIGELAAPLGGGFGGDVGQSAQDLRTGSPRSCPWRRAARRRPGPRPPPPRRHRRPRRPPEPRPRAW